MKSTIHSVPARAQGQESGGVMNRIVAQFITEIDILRTSLQCVTVIGTTNRIDLIGIFYIYDTSDISSIISIIQIRRFSLLVVLRL
jgi:hypothetical protein